MMRRVVAASVLCSAVLFSAGNVNAQRGNMSDATGATLGLFSRGVVRAFGAPPAPPPTLIVSPAMLDALCVERADAMITYATLATTAETAAERSALALLIGGPAGDAAAQSMLETFVKAGAGLAETDQLLRAAYGLLAPGQPEVVNVAAAVTRYNELLVGASTDFLARPPAELTALRTALGRLTAAANHAYAAERVYPGLAPLGMKYANGADWLLSGQALQVAGESYFQYGPAITIGDRRFKHVADFNGVWVLAEEPVTGTPPILYVPLRAQCDVELLPYKVEEKVIKRQSLLFRQ